MEIKGSSKLEQNMKDSGNVQAQSWGINNFAVCLSRNPRKGAAITSPYCQLQCICEDGNISMQHFQLKYCRNKVGLQVCRLVHACQTLRPVHAHKRSTETCRMPFPHLSRHYCSFSKQGVPFSHSSQSLKQLCTRKLCRALAGDKSFIADPCPCLGNLQQKELQEFICAA